jgi:hypothetical protein
MTTILAFLAGIFLSWPALIFLCLFGIWAEYAEWRAAAVFFGIVTALSAIFFFNVPIINVLYYSAAYVLVGVLWSIWRYKRFLRNRIEEFNLKGQRERENLKSHVLRELTPTENISLMLTWVVIWPFSFIENVTRDILKVIEMQIRTTLRKIYEYVYNSEIKNIKE